MKESIQFQSLSRQSQVQFFVQCQKILIENHPTSEFLLTKEDWQNKRYFAIEFIKKYKGYAYWNENLCVLFNKVKIEDPNNPIKSLKDHLFKPPIDDYNGYTIDFAVFRKMQDSLEFINKENNPKIQYILFVKNNEVKLYNTSKLLEKLNNPLIKMFSI